MNVNVTLRKWGNSLGAVLPKDFVQSEQLKEGQRVSICVIKEMDFSEIFGTLPRKMSGQDFKNSVKGGWE